MLLIYILGHWFPWRILISNITSINVKSVYAKSFNEYFNKDTYQYSFQEGDHKPTKGACFLESMHIAKKKMYGRFKC